MQRRLKVKLFRRESGGLASLGAKRYHIDGGAICHHSIRKGCGGPNVGSLQVLGWSGRHPPYFLYVAEAKCLKKTFRRIPVSVVA
jgi:hypothetical protein